MNDDPAARTGPITPDEIADLEWESGFAAHEMETETREAAEHPLHADPPRRLPPEIEKMIAEGKARGISYSMTRDLDGRRHVSAIHLDDPAQPDPLADAILDKVTDGIDMPVIIDGQWFIIRRLHGPVPLT